MVGTHALFQEHVVFHDLGLVVIDEQHRFGVKQRLELGEKGGGCDVLIMTATPIQTDPMELIKLINLFKMPDKQLPDNFDLFSEEYLDNNGVFKPQALEKFRNETAGYISYLNREKDARQFSQPIVSLVKTDALQGLEAELCCNINSLTCLTHAL